MFKELGTFASASLITFFCVSLPQSERHSLQSVWHRRSFTALVMTDRKFAHAVRSCPDQLVYMPMPILMCPTRDCSHNCQALNRRTTSEHAHLSMPPVSRQALLEYVLVYLRAPYVCATCASFPSSCPTGRHDVDQARHVNLIQFRIVCGGSCACRIARQAKCLRKRERKKEIIAHSRRPSSVVTAGGQAAFGRCKRDSGLALRGRFSCTS